MYKPKFNSVLVEIDNSDEKWTKTDDNMLGRSYSRGKVVSIGLILPTNDYPLIESDADRSLFIDTVMKSNGKEVIWNEGAESGTMFEEDGKLYGFIYWWDIRGVKDGNVE